MICSFRVRLLFIIEKMMKIQIYKKIKNIFFQKFIAFQFHNMYKYD